MNCRYSHIHIRNQLAITVIANQPVITLSASQAPERAASILINVTTRLTEVSSCYRASFELSPPGICWVRYPSSSYCSSSNLLAQNTFSIWAFHRSEVRGPPGLICRLSKEKAAPDIWKWKLQWSVTVPELSNNFKWLVLSEPTLSALTLTMQREK